MSKINRKRDTITLCSWEQLEKIFDIDTKQKFKINYNVTDDKKLFHWIFATEIQDNKNRQDFSIIKKLKANATVKNLFDQALIKAGADLTRLTDPNYYLVRLRMLYENDFLRPSEIHAELIELRPDNNRGVKGIAHSWNAKHPTTASYWKKILMSAGIIDVTSLIIQSQERARNKHCHVIWMKKEKQTAITMCDQIEVLKPWERSEEFKNLFAA